MKKMFFLFVATTLLCSTTYAQMSSEGSAFENFGASLKFGVMNGVGFDFSTLLYPNLTARVGFNYLGYDATNIIKISKNNTDLEQGKLNFVNANLLVDYHPMENSMFHITTGVLIGSHKAVIEGNGFDPFSISDYVIITDPVGYFKGTVKFGGVVKPYLGIGVGPTIPNKPVDVKIELGVVYQGKVKVKSDYLNPSMKPSDVDDEIKFQMLESKFWPSATLSLVFRLK